MAAPVAAKVAIQVAQSKTGRRIIGGVLALVLAIAMLPVFIIGSMAFALAGNNAEECPVPGDAGGFTSEQLGNAQTIRSVAGELGISHDGVKIAIMVGLVESGLLNLANSTVPESLGLPQQGTPGSDHDSVGVFQQRPSAGWGTVSELMTPAYAAKAFFGGPSGPNGGSPRGLLDVPGWEDLPLGVAAQRVQVSAFPDAYEKRAQDADAVLGAIGGAGSTCGGGGDGGTPPKVVGGWANPIGMQTWATYPNHSGGAMDVHVGVGTPVYAPAAGKTWDLSEVCGGKVLGVQHDTQYTTVFAHLSSFAVQPGASVKAGQLIGYSGASGSCVDGAHLHFEVRVGPNPQAWGNFIPAYRFMRQVGIQMGECTGGCSLYPT